jgi:hypothetical protein
MALVPERIRAEGGLVRDASALRPHRGAARVLAPATVQSEADAGGARAGRRSSAGGRSVSATG